MSPAQSHKMTSMLTHLPDRCPHLKRLTLQSSSDGTPVDIRLDDVLTFLPYLTSLRISPIILTPQLMQNIALLPRLEHLNLSEPSYGKSLTIPSLPHNGFPSITTLMLSHPFKDVALFLESCPLRDLRNLTIIHFKTESTKLYLRVLETSISRCPKLKRMKLVGKMRFEQPVLKLSHRNALSLRDISMTADAIAHIARILPSLQQLSLSHSSRSRDHPLPPISMLPTLGSMCPRLIKLRIDVDTSPGALAHITSGTLSFPCLEELNVGYSYLDSPVTEVAAFLSGILRDGCCLLRARLNAEHDIYESWQQVVDLLPVLIRIRNAGRDAAANVGTASMS
ncbi:hypothetical protein EYR40_004716 [Pleurotus pulmonarius]|nr:hypothetical protein EYR36_004129 [Pleurotus pulmonarius]KAF4605924.1 hypothetical protein EYR40_004716 [Pleurotus pulmonarius]